MPKTPRKPKFRTLLRLDEQKWLQKKKTKACSLHPVPPAVLRYSGWALFLKMRLFQSLNQAQFHLDHWVANIVSGRRRSHSSWTLTHAPVVSLTISQVAHTWPFNCPKPESIFSLQLLVFRSVLQGRGGSAGPSLALSGEQSACVQWHSRWNEKKHETRSKCAVRAQRRFFFPFLFPHSLRLLPAWSRQRRHAWKVGMWKNRQNVLKGTMGRASLLVVKLCFLAVSSAR